MLNKKTMKEWLIEWPWQWFVTLTFPYPVNIAGAESRLKWWRLTLCKAEGIQIAHMGVFNFLTNPHIHLLMLGKNQHGKTLLEAETKRAERFWSAEAKIKRIKDEGSVGYMVDKNMPAGRYELITPYNKKLLKKTRIEK